jgi:DNA-binding NtrC family response regulator
MKYKILIVDDEEAARFGIRKALTGRDNILLEAGTLQAARVLLGAEKPDVLLLDVNLPDGSGMDLLSEITALSEAPLVVVVTAYGSERMAIEAIKRGAYDYLSKPFEIDDLRLVVKNATGTIELRRENLRLRQRVEEAEGLGELIGQSAPIKRTFDLIQKVSATDVTVLILGESGTGKELVARELHRRSPRAGNPFVATNCAAMPETLVESELFGYERGAFTGAASQRKGKFELAQGGTLFLDEVGDMSLATQAKVLRALEERVIERLGGNKTISTDVRILAATNKDLPAEIKDGNFREDLYYRLCVVCIQLPPLRERGSDVVLLAEHFCRRFAAIHGHPETELTPAAKARLAGYFWPGNVRELKNVIERAVVLSAGGPLDVRDLPESLAAVAPQAHGTAEFSRFLEMKYLEARGVFDREYFTAFLEACGGNLSRAAEAMGLHRQTLQYRLKQLGIRKKWTD